MDIPVAAPPGAHGPGHRGPFMDSHVLGSLGPTTGLQPPLATVFSWDDPRVWGQRVTGVRGSPAAPTYPLPDDDALVLPIDQHVAVHVIGQGVDMGGIFILSLNRGQEQQC